MSVSENHHSRSLSLSLSYSHSNSLPLVTVPPNIDDSQSSSDVIVREGANVTLTCHATGSPPPSVKWKRDDGSKIAINKSLTGMIQRLWLIASSKTQHLLKFLNTACRCRHDCPCVSLHTRSGIQIMPRAWKIRTCSCCQHRVNLQAFINLVTVSHM